MQIDSSGRQLMCAREIGETTRWKLRSALILAGFVAAIYSNSLSAIWTLDDIPNILQNPRIHIDSIHPASLFRTFFLPLVSDQSGSTHISRPVAQLSFGLNWLIGRDSPIGYRLVNIAIHFLAAFFLFLTTRDLLRAPALTGRFARAESIALLSALLWAVNPIQSQSVVYIVQRMASLACLFYLIGMWSYIRGRFASAGYRWPWFTAAILAYAAAVGSKENALMLPAAIILVEITFFRNGASVHISPRLKFMIGSSICLLLAIVGWLLSTGKLTAYLDYSSRLFTLTERLMTQPRILIFYLSQIAYPIPRRLSIEHDIEISRSIFDPWTTLPAILLVLGLVIFALVQLRRRPLIGFAVLFYFLNHVIESSIIPLELIFEHRNYLPSLFLFVPVAIWLLKIIEYFRPGQPSIRRLLYAFPIMLVICLGASTYTRNMAWLDARTFWEDAMEKAPLSMRPVHNLAYEHYERIGDKSTAFRLYQKELDLRGYNRQDISTAHINLANYYYQQRDFNRASEHLCSAQVAFPGFELVRYLQSFVYFKGGQTEKALDILQPLAAEHSDSFEVRYLLAQTLLKMGRATEASEQLLKCMRIMPESENVFFLAAIAANRSGDYGRAVELLRTVLVRSPGNKHALLWMIDCRLRSGEPVSAEAYVSKFVEGLPVGSIEYSINQLLLDGYMPEASRNQLLQLILDHPNIGKTTETLEESDKGVSVKQKKILGS